MKVIQNLFLCLSLASACDSNLSHPTANSNALQATEPVPVAAQTVRGMYKKTKGEGTLYDCASGKTYRTAEVPDSLYKAACQPAPYEGESVYLVAHGRLEPADMPGYAGRFSINQLDTLRPRSRKDSCLPYDFWCIGTEPFWSLLISEAEGGIFLKIMGEERGQAFPWVAPQKNGNNWTYATSHPDSGVPLRVVIRQEPCSDGMSDRVFQYAVELSLDGKKMSGCAER